MCPGFESVDGVEAGSPPPFPHPSGTPSVPTHGEGICSDAHQTHRAQAWPLENRSKLQTHFLQGKRMEEKNMEQGASPGVGVAQKRGLLLQQLWLCLPSLPQTGGWLSLPTWKVPRLPQQKGRGGLLCSVALSEERRTFKRPSKGYDALRGIHLAEMGTTGRS